MVEAPRAQEVHRQVPQERQREPLEAVEQRRHLLGACPAHEEYQEDRHQHLLRVGPGQLRVQLLEEPQAGQLEEQLQRREQEEALRRQDPG